MEVKNLAFNWYLCHFLDVLVVKVVFLSTELINVMSGCMTKDERVLGRVFTWTRSLIRIRRGLISAR
jgi:hypothetical protein